MQTHLGGSSMPTKNEILIYSLPDGSSNVEVYLNEDDMWINQSSLAKLFQTSTQNITMHIRHIYAEGELVEQATCKSDLQVQIEGNRQVKRAVKFYSLR